MSTHAVKEWFTPGVIIQLGGMVIVGLGLWFGNRADVRSLSEEQQRQGAAIKEMSAKIPDSAVIELRLHSLESKIESLDPVLLVGVKGDIENLKRQSLRQETKTSLLEDYVEGRISNMPYRPPSKRHILMIER